MVARLKINRYVAGRFITKALFLSARSRSRLPKNLFGEQVGEGMAGPSDNLLQHFQAHCLSHLR
jgi:hypothetical protein